MLKYPRTHHLEGSRLQLGDEAKDQVSFASIKGRKLIVEEKVDGANCGLSFEDGALMLQSRGHYLTGGTRERQFGPFKEWASVYQTDFRNRLGNRYIVYGEWMFAKHTVYYDRLPHYFLEFDIYDRESKVFLATEERKGLLEGLPVVSVPVVGEGVFLNLKELVGLVKPSLYKSDKWKDVLVEAAATAGVDPERALMETENSDLAEGLYIKIEESGQVVERLKWVRTDFLQSILDSGSHWQSRPLIQNRLADGVALF